MAPADARLWARLCSAAVSPATLFSRAFVLAFAGNFLHSFSFFLYLHLPGYLTQLGAREVVIGIVAGTMAASAIAIRPLVGRLMDRRGRHVVVWAGSVINVLAAVSYVWVGDVGPLLFVIRIAHGIAEGMLFSALFTIAADVAPPARRTEAMALFGVSGMIPMSLAGLAGDAILAVADYDALFIGATVAAAGGLLCGLPLSDSRPPPDPNAPPRRSFLVTVRQRAFLPLWLLTFAFSVAIASYFTFLKTFVEQAGIGSMGLFFTVYSVVAVLLRVVLGWVPDRIGPRLSLVPAMMAVVGGLVALALAEGAMGIAVAGLLCGTGHAFVFPIISALVVARAEASERGAALSMFTALFDFGLLVGSPVLGWVLEASDYRTMFATAAVSVAVGGLWVAAWERALDRRAAG